MTYNPLSQKHSQNIIFLEVFVEMQKEFGMAIKKLREETGLSQEKFALSICMDRTYYASVEAGKRNISLQNICKIAKGFDLSVSALFTVAESYSK